MTETMNARTAGRCAERLAPPSSLPPSEALLLPTKLTVCALPHGHAGWHRADNGSEWSPDPDGGLPVLLAAVDNALRNGSYMTGANLAFNMLCDRLGVDRDRLVFRPDWAARTRQEAKR